LALLTERSFEASSIRLNYAEGPESGPPLVLFHGILDRWQTWLSLMPALVLRWHVYAVDHRGHGRSGRSKDGYERGGYASDAIEFLRAKVDSPAVLIGHSLGAGVVIQVAADAPELVRAAVMEDPARLRAPRPSALSGVGSRFAEEAELLNRTQDFDELVEGLQRIYPEAGPAENRDRARKRTLVDPRVLDQITAPSGPGQPDMEPVLKRIQAPALLVHGDSDLGGIVGEEDAAWAASVVRDLSIAHIEGVGHGIHRGRRAEFQSVVLDFLESL